jgi:hypothetical protein
MQDRSLSPSPPPPPALCLPCPLHRPPWASRSNPNLIPVPTPPHLALSPVTKSHTTRKRRWWRWHGAWA